MRAVLNAMPTTLDLPSEDDPMSCTNSSPIANWCPIESFTQFENQSTEFLRSSMLLWCMLFDQLLGTPFGKSTQIHTKNTRLYGCPGSGKSHVEKYVCLAVLAMGLRLLSTALMGTRANVLGGIHFHRLLCFPTGNIATPHHTELTVQKLTRPAQAKCLYFVLTMDVLFFDEIGQLSAQQIDALDIILRTLWNIDIPFGGVHVFDEYHISQRNIVKHIGSQLLHFVNQSSMGHTQIKAICGWSILLSTHVLLDFVLIELESSVQAHSDRQPQRLQKMTRMSTRALLHDSSF